MPLFVANSIGQFERCWLQLTCGRGINIVLLERPALGEDRMHRRLWVSWVFKVAIDQQLLRLRT